MIYKYHIYITSICISYIYKYVKFHCHICAVQMPNNKMLLDYNHTIGLLVIYGYISVTRTG